MSAHAILGASSAHRWMHCPPSALLAQTYEDTTSEFAEEGTAAHAMAETQLYKELPKLGYTVASQPKPQTKREKELLTKYAGPAMREYIEHYVALVAEHLGEMQNPRVFLEQRLDYSEYVPGGFGTGDVVAVGGGVAEIIDLKYGKGVPVSAEENPQLMLYGLGMLLGYGVIEDISTVRCTIVQPRLDSISTFEISADDLLAWAENVVRPVALLAAKGDGEYAAGDWCQFCRAAGDCKARAETNLELARREFTREAAVLTPEEAGAMYAEVETFAKWATCFLDTVKKRAIEEGVQYPGYKVVEGRSTRVITDPVTLRDVLLAAGYERSDIETTKLNGITTLEKLCGKKAFAELAEGCMDKPPGKPAFVPEDDPRPVLNTFAQAQADFAPTDDTDKE